MPTLLMCVECSGDEVYHSVDFCAKCFANGTSAVVMEGEGVHHGPLHHLIQLRSAPLRHYRQSMLAAAKELVAWVKDYVLSPEGAPSMVVLEGVIRRAPVKGEGVDQDIQCTVCERAITASPYWCCMTCSGVCAHSKAPYHTEEPMKFSRSSVTSVICA